MIVNILKRFAYLLVVLLLITSCAKDEQIKNNHSNATQTVKPSSIDSENTNIGVEKGEIIPLKGKRDTLPVPTKSGYAGSSALYGEVLEIRELPVYLKVKENISGKRYLTTQGIGQELDFNYFQGNLDQQFYIKIYSASSGIPSVIYSKKHDLPISVGSYSSAPEDHVLYTRTSDSGSMFGAAWDILNGTSDNGFVLESQDYLSEDTSGGWYTVYNNVVESSYSGITFGKYTQDLTQEFEIIPVENFRVESVEFIDDNTASLQQLPDRVISTTYINDGPLEQSRTVSLSEQVTETSDFKKTSKLSVTVSSSIEVKVPFINGSIDVSTTAGQEYTYGESESIQKTISHDFPLRIPPYSKVECQIILNNYEADINYIATCVGVNTGREITIEGVWTGTSISNDITQVKTTSLNDPSQTSTIVLDGEPSGTINLSY